MLFYAKGVSTHEIQDHLQRLYGIEVVFSLLPRKGKAAFKVIHLLKAPNSWHENYTRIILVALIVLNKINLK